MPQTFTIKTASDAEVKWGGLVVGYFRFNKENRRAEFFPRETDECVKISLTAYQLENLAHQLEQFSKTCGVRR